MRGRPRPRHGRFKKAITPAAAARAEAERHVAASQSINEKIALDRQKRQDEQKKQAQTERDAHQCQD